MTAFKKKKLKLYLPLLVLLVVSLFLLRGLWLDPKKLPSVFIHKPLPHFNLPTLEHVRSGSEKIPFNEFMNNATFQGKPWVLNVFASWCQACVQEHVYLMQIAKKNSIQLVGLAYKDDPDATLNWLTKHGNPYNTVLVDESGRAGIEFGVYGVPETFLITSEGLVNYKHVGPIDADFFTQHINPLIQMDATQNDHSQ